MPAASQMALLRACRSILRFIPGTAQDVRSYFLTCSTGWPAPMTTSPTWSAYSSTAMPTARGAPCAAQLKVQPPPVSIPEVGLYHPRRAASPNASSAPGGGPAARGQAAPSASWSCAPTSWPATPPIMTASSPPSRRGASASSPPSPAASTPAPRSSSTSAATTRPWSTRSSPSPASRWSAGRPTTTPAPPRRRWPRSTCPISPPSRWSFRPSSSGKARTAGSCPSKPP